MANVIAQEIKKSEVLNWIALQFSGLNAGDAAKQVGRDKRSLENWRKNLFGGEGLVQLKSANIRNAFKAGLKPEVAFSKMADVDLENLKELLEIANEKKGPALKMKSGKKAVSKAQDIAGLSEKEFLSEHVKIIELGNAFSLVAKHFGFDVSAR